MSRPKTLVERYPPSKPCTCPVCVGYCQRPGWWTVAEAVRVIDEGYAWRMMLEMAPDRSFGVLSPAFKGCEGGFALQLFAGRGCTFLYDERCELFGTGLTPLECRHVCHNRPGAGQRCHADIEKDWNTPAGRSVVVRWSRLVGMLKHAPIL